MPASRFEAEARAGEIEREAEARASKLLAEAEARAAALLEAAAGEAESLRRRAIGQAELAHEAAVREGARDVLRLGLELARRLIRRTLEAEPALYAEMAEALVAEARASGPGWLRVPEGVSLAIDGFDIVADPSLSPGDLIVEMEGARLDARLDERLAALGALLDDEE